MKSSDIGIFLHRYPFSESSAIVSYYTRDHGFQKYIFLGAKKKGSQLFPLNVQELETFHRPDSELGKLSSAKNALPNLEIPFHPIRSSIAFLLAEIILKCLNHTEEDKVLFKFLYESVEELNETDELALFPLRFLIGFSSFLGFEPHITEENPTCFHLDDGNFDRFPKAQNTIQGEPMLLLMQLMQNKENIKSNLACRRAAMDGLLLYYRYHIENFGKLKSKEIIDLLFSA
jgi:DNA repair protein RecO (recombination protein O)